MMLRGDIHYIMEGKYTGSEQNAGRPAIIVSNDKCNALSPVIEVVFLTTRPKHDMPTHITIRSATHISTALCEQVTSVSIERLGDYVGTCTPIEMEAIDRALKISLALDTPMEHVKSISQDTEYIKELQKALSVVEGERDLFKNMYNGLVDRLLEKSGGGSNG